MEEDIKILEQFLRGNKYCEDCEEKCVDCYIEYEEVQAVANLIKEYKKKEKIINAMAEQLTSPIHNKEYVIEYFKNKVEREDK